MPLRPATVFRYGSIAYLAFVLCMSFLWVFLHIADSRGVWEATGEYLIGGDFINYYSASELWKLNQIGTLLNVEEYQAYLRDVYGKTMPRNWSYPPSFILFLLPLATLSYVAAYAVWAIGGMLGFVSGTLKSLSGAISSTRLQVLLLAFAPASMINIYYGQNGFITGALLFLGVRLAPSHPAICGVCLGLLTIKPQLGLLIPIMLILTRNWTAIAVATMTAIALFCVSVLVFGWQSWIDYVELVLPFQRYVMEEWSGLFLRMMPGAYAFGRQLGLEPNLCWILQIPMTVIALGTALWLYSKPRHDREATDLLFLICVFLATPYSFNYDMTVLVPALLLYMAVRSKEQPLNWAQLCLIAGLLLLPIVIQFVPIGPFVMLAAVGFLVSEISAAERGKQVLLFA